MVELSGDTDIAGRPGPQAVRNGIFGWNDVGLF